MIGAELDQPLTTSEEALLRALARVLVVLPRRLDADLLEAERLSLNDYLVLVHLSEAPDRRLRMSDLAALVRISLSGMTHAVDRLAREHLVDRVKCTEDGRGSFAVLTDAGFARLERAYPANLASVRRRIFDHLDGVDLASLTGALQRIGESADDSVSAGYS